MNLGLQLHLNIQIDIQPQSQLLITALALFPFSLALPSTENASNGLARAPRDPVHCIACCVLHQIAGLVNAAKATERAV